MNRFFLTKSILLRNEFNPGGLADPRDLATLKLYFEDQLFDLQRTAMDDPYGLLVGKPQGTFVTFLSHFKREACGVARMLKDAVSRDLGITQQSIFLDSCGLGCTCSAAYEQYHEIWVRLL